MNIYRPKVNYSLAIHDAALILTPGDATNYGKEDQVSSLGYRFPEDSTLTLESDRIVIGPDYKPILSQPENQEILTRQLDVHDIEFVYYQGHPYLYYTDEELLLIRVPDCLGEILDPIIKDKYVTTLIDSKVYLCTLSSLNRVVKKQEMKLEPSVELVYHENQDQNKILEASYFIKFDTNINLKECSLLRQKEHITLVTSKISAHLATTLASVPDSPSESS